MKVKKYQPAPDEFPVSVACNGLRLRIPLPGAITSPLEERYSAGINMMFELIAREIPDLREIELNGLVLTDPEIEFHVFTVFVKTKDGSGFFLPLKESARLLSDNGIPYVRFTARQDLP